MPLLFPLSQILKGGNRLPSLSLAVVQTAQHYCRDVIKNLCIDSAATDSKAFLKGSLLVAPTSPWRRGRVHNFDIFFKNNKELPFVNFTSMQQVICKELKYYPQVSMSVLTKITSSMSCSFAVKGLLIVFWFNHPKSTLLFCPASMALMKGIFNFECKAALNLP